jgi:hypothetical protein
VIASRRITKALFVVAVATALTAPRVAQADVVVDRPTQSCAGTGTLSASWNAADGVYDLHLLLTGTCVSAQSGVASLAMDFGGFLEPSLLDAPCPFPTGGQLVLFGSPVVGGVTEDGMEMVGLNDWPGDVALVTTAQVPSTFDNGTGLLVDGTPSVCGPGGAGWTDGVTLQFSSTVAVSNAI